MSHINEPAVALIELRSIARGVKTADEMVKKSPVRLMEARTVCPGKYMILITGETAAIEESYRHGIEIGAEMVLDELFLPNADLQLIPAMEACTHIEKMRSLAVIETFTVASAILSADCAVKTGDVELIELRLANGLGGKSFYTMTGELDGLEAATEAGLEIIATAGVVVASEIIPNPHQDIDLKLL